MTPQAAKIESPCVRDCVLDPSTGYCLGCFRTLDEICRWASYTPEERRRVTEHLQARRAARRGGNIAS
jgi:predicted Fe-S protein YdhL (DUF1289 family)